MVPVREELWSRLISWTSVHGSESLQAARAGAGMHPAQARVIMLLEPGVHLKMQEIASGLGCHGSNVTALIGRLEAAGLVERVSCPQDGRVRHVRLTGQGETKHRQLLSLAAAYPRAFGDLRDEDLEALDRILGSLESTACSSE